MSEKQELLAKLREARENNGLSYQNIVDITEANGEAVSMSTVKRVFAKDSDIDDFRFQQTIRPIVRAVLGADEPDSTALNDEQPIAPTIAELQAEIDHKAELLEIRTSEYEKNLEFLKNTIAAQQSDLAWYKRVVVVLGIIALCALVSVIVDLAIGTVGWFRY